MRGFDLTLRAWIWRGPHDKECGSTLEAESGPWLAARKIKETSVPQLPETEFCQQQEWAWKWIFAQSPQKRSRGLTDVFISDLLRSWAEKPAILCLDSWPIETVIQEIFVVLRCWVCSNLLHSNRKLIHVGRYTKLTETPKAVPGNSPKSHPIYLSISSTALRHYLLELPATQV